MCEGTPYVGCLGINKGYESSVSSHIDLTNAMVLCGKEAKFSPSLITETPIPSDNLDL